MEYEDCEGCKWEDLKTNEWPCCNCARVNRNDMYEEKDDEQEENT